MSGTDKEPLKKKSTETSKETSLINIYEHVADTKPKQESEDSLKVPSSSLGQRISNLIVENPTKWDRHGGKLTYGTIESKNEGTITTLKHINDDYIVSIASNRIEALLKPHPSAGKLFDYINNLAIQGHYVDAKNYIICIDITGEYKEFRGSKAKNNKDFINQFSRDMEFMKSFNILENPDTNNSKSIKKSSIKLKSALYIFGGTLLPLEEDIKRGKVIFGLNPVYVNNVIQNSHFTPIPKRLYKYSSNGKQNDEMLEIYKKLKFHNQINKNKNNQHCIKLSSLIKAIPNKPTVQEIESKDRAFTRKLLMPTLNNLELMVQEKYLLAWDFCNSNQQPLKEEELLKIDPESTTYDWETLYNQLIYFYFPEEAIELEKLDSKHDLEDKNLN